MYTICLYAEHPYAEHCYAKCHYGECHGASEMVISPPKISLLNFFHFFLFMPNIWRQFVSPTCHFTECLKDYSKETTGGFIEYISPAKKGQQSVTEFF
jgi:hypothetical protein